MALLFRPGSGGGRGGGQEPLLGNGSKIMVKGFRTYYYYSFLPFVPTLFSLSAPTPLTQNCYA